MNFFEIGDLADKVYDRIMELQKKKTQLLSEFREIHTEYLENKSEEIKELVEFKDQEIIAVDLILNIFKVVCDGDIDTIINLSRSEYIKKEVDLKNHMKLAFSKLITSLSKSDETCQSN